MLTSGLYCLLVMYFCVKDEYKEDESRAVSLRCCAGSWTFRKSVPFFQFLL